MKKLYIIYKEKTNKMYLLMLCGLLVSGAIVCSTNGDGDGNGGNGNGNPLMFACPNGTAFTPTADNRPIVMGVENCVSCEPGFTLEAVRGSNRMVCRTPYVCPDGVAVIPTEDDRPTMTNVENCVFCNEGFGEVTQGERMVCRIPFVCTNGTEAEGGSTTNNVENCAECTAGFTLEAVQGSDRMVCRTPYVCPNGTEVTPTEDNIPTVAGVENCASCNTDAGFSLEADGTLNVCRTPYVCPNGTIQNGTTTMANIENCDSCATVGFTLEAVQGSDRMVCRTPYVCTNGTEVTATEDNRPTVAGEENCAECDSGFGEVAQGERTTCQPEFTCPSGTEITETRPAIAMAGVENCSACDPGFGNPMAVAGSDPERSICSGNELPIALWNAGNHTGGFGFSLCQNRIAESSTDTIGSDLTTRGYTKAVFFGSTNTYDFPDIGTDTDALALPAVGGGSPVSVSDRNIVVFTVSSGAVSVTNTFGAPAVTRTLGNVTNVTVGGAWQNGGADVVGAAGIGSSAFGWSFTVNRTFSTSNCNDATSSIGGGLGGTHLNTNSVDSRTNSTSSRTPCNITRFVLCVAR